MDTIFDLPQDVRDISHDLLSTISETYLTPSEQEFIMLTLNERRTKEISELLDLLPCEVVRRRKVITKKIKAIYTYHYKLNYVEFLRFAVNVLTEDKFKCLIMYYVEMKSLKDISQILNTQSFKVLRKLHAAKDTLDQFMEEEPFLKEYSNWFLDLRHINIKVINRSKKDARKLSKIQIGENTLKEWLSKNVVIK